VTTCAQKSDMAKKSQRKHAVETYLTRKQISHLARERKQEKLLLWGVVAVAVALVVVLGYGIISETYIKARRPVAIVGDAEIRTAEFQARVRFTRLQMQNELSSLQANRMSLDPDDERSQFLLDYIEGQIRDLESRLAPENAGFIGDQVLQQLIDEQLVRQEAARRGIAVTADEIQTAIELGFGYDRTADPASSTPVTSTQDLEPTPTPMTEEAFQEQYGRFVERVLGSQDIPELLYRSWIESALLTDKVQEAMVEEMPTSEDQVKGNLLSLPAEEQADKFLARWNSGEDFQSLADELADSEDSDGYGQEIDWLPKGLWELQFGADVADLAFGLAVGERGGPVQGSDARFYVLEVLGHEVREMDEYVRQQRASESFNAWLTARQAVAVETVAYKADIVPTEP